MHLVAQETAKLPEVKAEDTKKSGTQTRAALRSGRVAESFSDLHTLQFAFLQSIELRGCTYLM